MAFAAPSALPLRPPRMPPPLSSAAPLHVVSARVSAPPRMRPRPKYTRHERLATLDVSLKPRLLHRAAYLGPVALFKVSGALELAESVDLLLAARNVAVADICVQLGMDCDTVCAAILRGTVGLLGSMAVEAAVGSATLAILRCYDEIDEIVFRSEDSRFTEESYSALRSLVLVAARNEHRALSLRLAGAVVDARAFDLLPSKRSREIAARRAMYLEAPLANQLGMWYMQSELEENAFRHLLPAEYRRTKADLKARVEASDDLLSTTKTDIESVLHRSRSVRSVVSRARIMGRVKGAYSVYRKMQRSTKRLDQIYDVLALRVIIAPKKVARDSDECAACNAVAQAIRDSYPTLENREKDYLRRPKSNGYRSLHLTILTGKENVPLEVQIRTEKMHHVAEFGAAAHWLYKDAASPAVGTPTYTPHHMLSAPLKSEGQREPRVRLPLNLAPASVLDEKRRGYVHHVADAIAASHVIVKCVGQLWAMRDGATIRDLYMDMGVLGIGARAMVNGVRAPLNKPLRMNDSVGFSLDF